MHAVVGIWNMDRSKFAQQQQFLREVIVPSAKARPGFVRGYWSCDHADSKYYSVVLLDSEESARELVGWIKEQTQTQDPAKDGVSMGSLTITEVLAEAGA